MEEQKNGDNETNYEWTGNINGNWWWSNSYNGKYGFG